MASDEAETMDASTSLAIDDADFADRVISYLQERESNLDEGRRAWLRRFDALKRQEEDLLAKNEDIELRRTRAAEIMDALASREQELKVDETTLTQRIAMFRSHTNALYNARRELNRSKEAVMEWMKQDNMAWGHLQERITRGTTAGTDLGLFPNDPSSQSRFTRGPDPLQVLEQITARGIWPPELTTPPIMRTTASRPRPRRSPQGSRSGSQAESILAALPRSVRSDGEFIPAQAICSRQCKS